MAPPPCRGRARGVRRAWSRAACRSAAPLRRSRGPILRPIRMKPSRAERHWPISAAAWSATRRKGALNLPAAVRCIRRSEPSTRQRITPDEATGIGRWSFGAFARAVREGVARDKAAVYPAFPYPSFTKTSEADLQALYAFLMAAPAVAAANRPAELRAPFAWRPLMAAWNTIFHRTAPFAAESGPGATSGIAAPIWSRVLGTAPHAIRRATRSAPNARGQIILRAARRTAGSRRR